jgi:hypothetical protein
MQERNGKNRTRPKHAERRERPHRSAQSRPGPCGLRGSLPPPAAGNRSTCFGRGKSLRQTDCMQPCMQPVDKFTYRKEEDRCQF